MPFSYDYLLSPCCVWASDARDSAVPMTDVVLSLKTSAFRGEVPEHLLE